MRFPIIIQGDWMQLTYEEAETREEALLKAATRYVQTVNKDGDITLCLGPRGVTGQCTPTAEIRVLYADSLELESEWTVPDVHD